MMNKKEKTCAFYTFGCKVNQYETQLIRETFSGVGFVEVTSDANVYVINGCTVTQKADRKCRQLIRRLHKRNPEAKIVITGCYAQNNPDLKSKIKEIACVVSQDEKTQIIDKINDTHDRNHLKKDTEKQIHDFADHNRAFMKIQDGCDNFCSYCIVPYMRGAPVSKSEASILKEARTLTDKGFKEIVLTGINLGTWGKGSARDEKLSVLIKKLCQIRKLQRLRLSSIELKDVSDDLIDQFNRNQKLCRHLHIPLQSADNRILSAMNRRYRVEDFWETLNILRAKIKNISLTTDIIVGFPGESEKEFRRTMEFVQEAGFLKVHVFPFSSREKTPAANLPQQVEKAIKSARVQQMSRIAQKAGFLQRKKVLGRELNVLFEDFHDGQWQGYSDEYIQVSVPSQIRLKNKLRRVIITRVSLSGTQGKLVE